MPNNGATYRVQSGDSLSKIARDVLGDMDRWPDIARLNNLTSPYTITPGQVLVLPDISVPGPVVIPRGAPGPVPAPVSAGIGFALTPRTLTYIALGLVLLFLLTEKR